SGLLLHELLAASAGARPDRVAVHDRGRELTYAELDARSDSLAGLLRDLGVAEGDRVGLYLDKQAQALTGIYGVLKAGAAYVPLDAHAPVPRLAYIAANCGIRVLVTGVEKAPVWEPLVREGAPHEALVVMNDEPGAPPPEPPPGVSLAASADIDGRPPI